MASAELKAKFTQLLDKKDKLKSNISATQASIDLLKKQKEEKLAELKEKFGFDSIEAAQKFLTDSESELNALMASFDEKMKAVTAPKAA